MEDKYREIVNVKIEDESGHKIVTIWNPETGGEIRMTANAAKTVGAFLVEHLGKSGCATGYKPDPMDIGDMEMDFVPSGMRESFKAEMEQIFRDIEKEEADLDYIQTPPAEINWQALAREILLRKMLKPHLGETREQPVVRLEMHRFN